MLSYDEIRKNEEIRTYIEMSDAVLGSMGYTEHSFAHVTKTAHTAKYILEKLGYPQKDIELAMIASYLHDIGNLVNRVEHAQSGAVMAFRILKALDFTPTEIATIISAIGNHDEHTAFPVNPIAAALIIADKTDVRRNRVQAAKPSDFDIHDRVNYAVLSASLELQMDKKVIQMNMELDDTMCSVMDYFEIFLQRMLMSKRAAEVLGCRFKLVANGSKVC